MIQGTRALLNVAILGELFVIRGCHIEIVVYCKSAPHSGIRRLSPQPCGRYPPHVRALHGVDMKPEHPFGPHFVALETPAAAQASVLSHQSLRNFTEIAEIHDCSW